MNFKKSFTLAAAGILAAAFILTPGKNSAPQVSYYTESAVVVAADWEANTATLMNGNGDTFHLDTLDEWTPGDIAKLVMCDNGTADIYDDDIIQITYAGYLEPGTKI